MELEYVVEDPKLGEVSCNDEDHARAYARAVNGTAWIVHWIDGEETGRDVLI